MKDVIRILSTGALVSSEAFGKLNAAKQTEALLAANAAPTILFVDNFRELKNMNKLRDRLLAGEDVSMELEFNEIKLTKDEIAAINAVRPVLTKLNSIVPPGYVWETDGSNDDSLLKGFRALSDQWKVSPKSNYFTLNNIKTIWEAASRFWYDGTPVSQKKIKIYYNNYSIKVTKDSVIIGCETFSRGTVEAMARRFKLEPNDKD